jgi:hypothetical protein
MVGYTFLKMILLLWRAVISVSLVISRRKWLECELTDNSAVASEEILLSLVVNTTADRVAHPELFVRTAPVQIRVLKDNTVVSVVACRPHSPPWGRIRVVRELTGEADINDRLV